MFQVTSFYQKISQDSAAAIRNNVNDDESVFLSLRSREANVDVRQKDSGETNK